MTKPMGLSIYTRYYKHIIDMVILPHIFKIQISWQLYFSCI